MRATSWLANWVDYGFAVILVVCRLFRVPSRRDGVAFEATPARASTHEGFRPRWHEEAAPEQRQHWIVRPAEIVMLTISFFLAAHLIGGGPAQVRAPQVNPLSYLSLTEAPQSAHDAGLADRGALVMEIQPLPVFSVPGGQSLADVVAEELPVTGDADLMAGEEPDPLPAPPERGSAPAAAGVSEPTPRPVATPSPEPTPAPTQAPAEPTPAPAATTAPAPAPGPSVLSYSYIYDLALQAGWPADRADEVARVAYCESSYRPRAVGYGTYGLMQLVPLWFSASGTDFDLWSDPLTNLKVALFAFETDLSYGNDPWAPWGCKPWRITLP